MDYCLKLAYARTLQKAMEISDGTMLSIAREVSADGRLRSVDDLRGVHQALLVLWLEQAQRTTRMMDSYARVIDSLNVDAA